VHGASGWVLRRLSEWKFSARRQSVRIVVDPPTFDDQGRLDEIAERMLVEFVTALITPDTAVGFGRGPIQRAECDHASAARCFFAILGRALPMESLAVQSGARSLLGDT
jgi:hypothetical protein